MTNDDKVLRFERTEVGREPPSAGTAKDEAAPTKAGDAPPPATVSTEINEGREVLLDRLARAQADFENTRRRLAKEQEDFKEFALAGALRSLLPILDSFDLALQAPAQNPADFRSGVELIRKQLHEALSKLGVAPISATGEPFDPRLHEAIETVESPAAADNHVIRELQRGYKLRDRLLRPAMVVVAKNSGRVGEDASDADHA
jgi:molecular chaperone GrpE